jgi:hypothetical protein
MFKSWRAFTARQLHNANLTTIASTTHHDRLNPPYLPLNAGEFAVFWRAFAVSQKEMWSPSPHHLRNARRASRFYAGEGDASEMKAEPIRCFDGVETRIVSATFRRRKHGLLHRTNGNKLKRTKA